MTHERNVMLATATLVLASLVISASGVRRHGCRRSDAVRTGRLGSCASSPAALGAARGSRRRPDLLAGSTVFRARSSFARPIRARSPGSWRRSPIPSRRAIGTIWHRASSAHASGPPDHLGATASWLDGRGLSRCRPPTRTICRSGSERPCRGSRRPSDLASSATRCRGARSASPPSAEPLVPAALATQVDGVLGLSDLGVPQPLLAGAVRASAPSLPGTASPRRPGCRAVDLRARRRAAAASTAGARNGAYTANQIASAYSMPAVYSQGRLGAGISVAVYELEPFAASDIQAYQSCYGTHAAVSVTSVDGAPGTGSGTGESALDIEQVIGLAPGFVGARLPGPFVPRRPQMPRRSTCTGGSRTTTVLPVVSTSWGICEAGLAPGFAAAESDVFQQMAAQGQSMFAASGDSGSEDCFVAGDTSPDANLAGRRSGQPALRDERGGHHAHVARASTLGDRLEQL